MILPAVYRVPTDAPRGIFQGLGALPKCKLSQVLFYHNPHSPGLLGDVGSLDLCGLFMTRLRSSLGHLMILDGACLSPLWPAGPFWVCCMKGMHHFSYLPSQLL